MTFKTCRTCLYPTTVSEAIKLENDVQDMLIYSFPQMNLLLSREPVLCPSCCTELTTTYKFKRKCFESEERIVKYLSSPMNNCTYVDLNVFSSNFKQCSSSPIKDANAPLEEVQTSNIYNSSSAVCNKFDGKDTYLDNIKEYKNTDVIQFDGLSKVKITFDIRPDEDDGDVKSEIVNEQNEMINMEDVEIKNEIDDTFTEEITENDVFSLSNTSNDFINYDDSQPSNNCNIYSSEGDVDKQKNDKNNGKIHIINVQSLAMNPFVVCGTETVVGDDTEKQAKKPKTKKVVKKKKRRAPTKVGMRQYKIKICVYCHKKVYRFSEHLETYHADEPDVAQFLSLPSKSPERLELLRKIRERSKNLPKNKSTKPPSSTTSNSRKVQHKQIEENSTKNENRMSTGRKKKATYEDKLLKQIILDKLYYNETDKTIKNDATILQFAAELCVEHEGNEEMYSVIRFKCQQLADLLLDLRSVDPEIENLEDAIVLDKFDMVMNTIKNITTKFGGEMYEVQLKRLIKRSAEVILRNSDNCKNTDMENEVREFIKLIKINNDGEDEDSGEELSLTVEDDGKKLEKITPVKNEGKKKEHEKEDKPASIPSDFKFPYFCPYCLKNVCKFTVHLVGHHKSEKLVSDLYDLQPRSPARNRILHQLRSEGISLAQKTYMQKQQSKEKSIEKQQTKEKSTPKQQSKEKSAQKSQQSKPGSKQSNGLTLQTACPYCSKKVYKFSQHLMRYHPSEKMVSQMLKLLPRTMERNKIIAVLRNKGNALVLKNGQTKIEEEDNSKKRKRETPSNEDRDAAKKIKTVESENSVDFTVATENEEQLPKTKAQSFQYLVPPARMKPPSKAYLKHFYYKVLHKFEPKYKEVILADDLLLEFGLTAFMKKPDSLACYYRYRLRKMVSLAMEMEELFPSTIKSFKDILINQDVFEVFYTVLCKHAGMTYEDGKLTKNRLASEMKTSILTISRLSLKYFDDEEEMQLVLQFNNKLKEKFL